MRAAQTRSPAGVSFAGRPNTASGRALTIGLLLAAAFGGEWLLHQIAYLIEYGNRFDVVMASTPHRLYMEPAGIALAVVLLLAVCVAAVVWRRLTLKYLHLRRILPWRVNRALPATRPHISSRRVARAALGLAAMQAATYCVQENLEALASTGRLSGLAMILPGQHPAVLPLDLLIAVLIALALSTAMSLLARSRRTLEVAEHFLGLLARRPVAPLRLRPRRSHVPNLRPFTGSCNLRSPPLTAA